MAAATQAEAHRAVEARRHAAVGDRASGTSRQRRPGRSTSATRPTDDVARVDLGALRVPVGDGLELHVDVNEAQQVVAATLDTAGRHDAARRRSPRRATRASGTRSAAEIAESIRGAARHHRRARGRPVRRRAAPARCPASGGRVPVRFIGVDGPRWFLRAMLVGAGGRRGQGRPVRGRAAPASSSCAAPIRCRCASRCRCSCRRTSNCPSGGGPAQADDAGRATELAATLDVVGKRHVAAAPPDGQRAAPRRRRAEQDVEIEKLPCARCTTLRAGQPAVVGGPAALGRLHPERERPDRRGRAVRRHRVDRAGLAGPAPHRRHRARPPDPGARPRRRARRPARRSTTPGTSSSAAAERTPSRSRRTNGDELDLRETYRKQMLAGIGGWHGMLITAIPTVVFVIVNAIASPAAGDHRRGRRPASLLTGYRLVRKQSVQQALTGLFGVLDRGGDRRPHRPGARLLPVRHLGRASCTPCRSSCRSLVRRPLVGAVWEFLDPTPRTRRAATAVVPAPAAAARLHLRHAGRHRAVPRRAASCS